MGGGDYIYAISEKGVTAHNVETMERTGFVELPSDNKPNYVDYYYGETVDVEYEEEEEEPEEEEPEEEREADSDESESDSGEESPPPEED